MLVGVERKGCRGRWRRSVLKFLSTFWILATCRKPPPLGRFRAVRMSWVCEVPAPDLVRIEETAEGHRRRSQIIDGLPRHRRPEKQAEGGARDRQ
ncbi:hypothetical protein C8R46DRAFT_1115629 [Mycena filopes]|nr:hypothetical protein C8R46DRAFT_1115629 [Mycena filopes]